MEAVKEIVKDFTLYLLTESHKQRVWKYFMNRLELIADNNYDDKETTFMIDYFKHLETLQTNRGKMAN